MQDKFQRNKIIHRPKIRVSLLTLFFTEFFFRVLYCVKWTKRSDVLFAIARILISKKNEAFAISSSTKSFEGKLSKCQNVLCALMHSLPFDKCVVSSNLRASNHKWNEHKVTNKMGPKILYSCLPRNVINFQEIVWKKRTRYVIKNSRE